MCGINGVVSLSSSASNMDIRGQLVSMNKALHHRGPDDSGVWVHEGTDMIGLAQTRLSILDLSAAGHQPMKDNESDNFITYNGEVFNFRRLRDSHLASSSFKSETDTETILKLYGKYGEGMLGMLNGMFAFGIWDEKRSELLLARDKSGKKPLYYTESNGYFAFSSELKALFALPWVQKELDEEALYDFLTYDLVLPPKTMFKNIFKFEPGYKMRVGTKGVLEYKPYYELKKSPLSFGSEEELADIVFNAFDKSVSDRMISDVPVGAFLSGGVDSSGVVALMRKNTEKQIKTFTIGFEGQPTYDEIAYSEKVSKLFNTDHHTKIVKPQDLLDFLPHIVEIYDEPQADTTSIPIYFISQLAKEQDIKVVLNGDGPDELFAGYSNFKRNAKYFPYFRALSKSPRFLRSVVYRSIKRRDNGHPVFEMMARLAAGQEFYWPGAQSLKESQKRAKLDDLFLKKIGNHSSYWYVDHLKKKYAAFNNTDGEIHDIIEWMCFTGFHHADIHRFLYRSDRLGMAHSIESRSPFLNIDVVELAMGIPSVYKIKNGEAKYILKKSFERILPNDVLYRKKMGFNLPIREWASETIASYVEENIDGFVSNYGVYRKEELKSQLKAFRSGNRNMTNSIWTTYFLMSWMDKWL